MSFEGRTLDEVVEYALCSGVIGEVKERTRVMVERFIAGHFQKAQTRLGHWREGSSTVYTPEEILEELSAAILKRPRT